ncbi:heme-binding protein [Herbiconiux moechotypicola]|uniref:Heme-binding protein n=1 Tax=Herbiconiux moechotypicola TaxID=637393 RepID=A0ABP5QBX3_9MICO|nr:heme-binding protein [Herbiconiux moechotypicola]MCS5729315.1 heme-binding protein [Herbiconiux moechotypicola]
MSTLTLDTAQLLIAAALEHAAQIGVPSTVTVMDTGARVVATARMDGAPLVSIDSSAAKARTSVFFGGAATGDLAGAVQPGAPLYTIGASTPEPLAFLAGGLPIVIAGEVVGAIGSGGGTPDQDHEVAGHAIAALAE